MERLRDGVSVFVMVAMGTVAAMPACQAPPPEEVTAARTSALTIPGQGERLIIDFDSDAAGTPLPRGTVLAEQYAAAGVHFENSFALGTHATDFPNVGTGNMVCTYEAGVDPTAPGRCFAGQPAAGTPLVVDLDFDACNVGLGMYSLANIQNPTGSIGHATMQGFDAQGTPITSIDLTVPPHLTVCGGTPCLLPGYILPGIPDTAPILLPPGRAYRKLAVSETGMLAFDDLTITRCPGFVARCVSQQSCAPPGQAFAPSVSIDQGTVDPDGNPVTLSQTPAGPFAIGASNLVTLTASNGITTSTCQAFIFAEDCTPPTLTCPAPFTVECAGELTSVTLPAAIAVDDLPGPLTVTGAGPAQLGPGTSVTVYRATDGGGNTSQCQSSVTVADTSPPIATVTGDDTITNSILSPADDRLHAVTLADCGVQLNDVCQGPLPLAGNAHITCVSSDEETRDDGRDDPPGCRDPRDRRPGRPAPDIVLVDDTTVELRATMNPNGDGRVYTIAFEASDASGNSTTGRCKVAVPDPHRRRPPADSGPHQTVCRR